MHNALLSRCAQLSGLTAEIDGIEELDAAPGLAARMRALLCQVVAADLGGEVAPRLVSACSDRLTARVIDLCAARHRLPPVAWCWLALGSEGRHEQTFVTDQDNGLVYSAADAREADALRTLFLPFAQEVNRRLADCGFALCSGGIMAGNPAWCLSLDEWRERFIEWVRVPDPQALLNASIFFDLRPLHGQLSLGEELRSLVLALTADTPSFLHLMGANALQAEVPLNFRGDIAVYGDGMLDLKKFGSRIFVDAARIFALARGIRAVHTADRLRAAGAQAGEAWLDVAAANTAFSLLMRLRLIDQLAGGDGQMLRPAMLNEMDRALLRAALHQARRLQQRIRMDYSL